MQYWKTVPAIFLTRPNRFIAIRQYNDETVRVHVKNTGRCAELLLPGTGIWLEPAASGQRKTAYSLIAVQKGNRLINLDSQAPNKAVEEALRNGTLCLPGIGRAETIRRETVFGASRFDFYVEGSGRRGFLEVKGVTLEEDGVCRFPDAPTERGVRHLHGLIEARKQGYEASVLFVIQMEGVRYLIPNDHTHPAFGEALRLAEQEGVTVFARDCAVSSDSMILRCPVPVYPGGAPGETTGGPPA